MLREVASMASTSAVRRVVRNGTMCWYMFFHGLQLYHYIIHHHVHLVLLVEVVMLIITADFLLAFVLYATIL